jgi:hypothetical protein
MTRDFELRQYAGGTKQIPRVARDDMRFIFDFRQDAGIGPRFFAQKTRKEVGGLTSRTPFGMTSFVFGGGCTETKPLRSG